MDKNWLIRTKSNHILGPISKEKVLELYGNGSIKSDDEVCSGNGFWFFVRETEMVEKYLHGEEIQNFNPISEAKDVLTGNNQPPQVDEDITMVGGINLSMLNGPATPSIPKAPAQTPAQASATATASTPHKAPDKETKPVAITKKKLKANVAVKPSASRKPLKKQNYLKVVGLLCFALLLALIYFRKTLIRSLFEGEVTLAHLILSSAHAQDEAPLKKKSSLRE